MVKLGIIGAGEVLEGAYLPIIPFLDDLEKVTIFDINPERLYQINEVLKTWYEKREYESYRSFFSDAKEKYKRMLETLETTTDIEKLFSESSHILILTPPATHIDIAKKCSERNIPVILEKPLGINYSEVEEFHLEVKTKGLQVFYVENFIYNNVFKKIKEEINEGKLGKILLIKSFLSNSLPNFSDNSWRFRKNVSGGGVLYDWGPHTIGTTLFLSGVLSNFRVENIETRYSTERSDIETYCLARIHHPESHINMLVESSWECSKNFEESSGEYFLEVHGEKGFYRVELHKKDGLKYYALTKSFNRKDPKTEIVNIDFPHDSYFYALNSIIKKDVFYSDFFQYSFGKKVLQLIKDLEAEN